MSRLLGRLTLGAQFTGLERRAKQPTGALNLIRTSELRSLQWNSEFIDDTILQKTTLTVFNPRY